MSNPAYVNGGSIASTMFAACRFSRTSVHLIARRRSMKTGARQLVRSRRMAK